MSSAPTSQTGRRELAVEKSQVAQTAKPHKCCSMKIRRGQLHKIRDLETVLLHLPRLSLTCYKPQYPNWGFRENLGLKLLSPFWAINRKKVIPLTAVIFRGGLLWRTYIRPPNAEYQNVFVSIKNFKTYRRAGKTAQWVKESATKPNELNWPPGPM